MDGSVNYACLWVGGLSCWIKDWLDGWFREVYMLVGWWVELMDQGLVGWMVQ
jgi:hypothetical protein